LWNLAGKNLSQRVRNTKYYLASFLGIRILKQKLLEYYHHGKPDTALPEYALHRILFLYSTHPEMVSL
jgi:hypothetical protein